MLTVQYGSQNKRSTNMQRRIVVILHGAWQTRAASGRNFLPVIGLLTRRMSLMRSCHATIVGPIRFSNRSNNCRVGKINERRSSLVRSHHAIIVFSSCLRPTKDEIRMVSAGHLDWLQVCSAPLGWLEVCNAPA